jgi:excisionase family DNA binding protein
MSVETIFKLKEVAKILKTSERTVRRMIEEGCLPAFKMRGQLRIPESSVKKYMEKLMIDFQLDNGVNEDFFSTL